MELRICKHFLFGYVITCSHYYLDLKLLIIADHLSFVFKTGSSAKLWELTQSLFEMVPRHPGGMKQLTLSPVFKLFGDLVTGDDVI